MNLRDAAALANRLIDAYPQFELREQTLEIYTKWLHDLDRGATERAVDELIATAVVLPTVAEVRRTVLEETTDLPTAVEAWLSLAERGHEIHELTREVGQLFGDTWGIRTSEEPGITRTQFLKAYEAARERRLRELNTSQFRRRRRAA
jgi:hypothetical protein